MRPYLTELMNKLMRLRPEIDTEERDAPDIGNLVDRTYLMLEKRNEAERLVPHQE